MATFRLFRGISEQYQLRPILAQLLLATISFLAFIYLYYVKHLFPELDLVNKAVPVYSSLFSAATGLLGFIITAYAIILGYLSNQKLIFLKTDEASRKTFHGIWTVTIKMLAINSIIYLIGSMNCSQFEPYLFFVVLFFTIFIILMIRKALSVFFSIIMIQFG